jgi:hypothetical protein
MYKREKPRNRTASGGSKVKEYFSWFFRGSFDSDRPTLGGVASVRLNWGLGGSSSRFGFRPSV